MKKLFTLIILIFAVVAVNAQWAQLTNSMLEGGRVANFEKQGSNLFIASDGGIYISSDNGATWQSSMSGYSAHTSYIDVICTHSTGLYSSGWGYTNYSTNGSTWTDLNPVGLPANSWIADFGEANDILYATVGEDMSSDIYLYYSTDGTNWNLSTYIGDEANELRYDLFNFHNTRQYLQIDSLLLYTTNGVDIDTISMVGITPPDRHYDDSFCGEPNGIYLYYADENNGTIHRYNTTTDLWEDITSNLPAGSMMNVGLMAGDDALFVTCLTAVPALALNLYRSLDHGTTWTLIPNHGLGSLPWIDELFQLGANEFIAVNPMNHVYYTNDNGNTWTKSQTGFLSSRHSSLVEVNNSLLSFDSQLGVMRSDDNGTTWSFSNGGLTPFLTDLYFIEDIFQFGTSTYISYQADPMVEDYNIYKSTDNGINWSLLATEPDSTNIIFCGQNASGFIIKLFSEESDNYSYQLTTDDGGTWTDITSSIDALGLYRNFGFYGSNSDWYLFGVDTGWTNHAYVSQNNGVSWIDISSGLNNNTDFNARYEGWDDKQSKIPIDFNSSNEPIIAMQKWDMWPYSTQFFKYSGGSWNIITSTGMDSEVEMGSELKNYSGEWIFAANEGVFISQDECATWQQVHTNHLNLLSGTEKFSMQRINDMIFLGTENNGIWMTDLSVNIDKIFAETNALVYPNPAEDILYIKNAVNANIRVLDISGREIKSFENVNAKVDISDISNGVYIINITQAGKTENTKIIIQ